MAVADLIKKFETFSHKSGTSGESEDDAHSNSVHASPKKRTIDPKVFVDGTAKNDKEHTQILKDLSTGDSAETGNSEDTETNTIFDEEKPTEMELEENSTEEPAQTQFEQSSTADAPSVSDENTAATVNEKKQETPTPDQAQEKLDTLASAVDEEATEKLFESVEVEEAEAELETSPMEVGLEGVEKPKELESHIDTAIASSSTNEELPEENKDAQQDDQDKEEGEDPSGNETHEAFEENKATVGTGGKKKNKKKNRKKKKNSGNSNNSSTEEQSTGEVVAELRH